MLLKDKIRSLFSGASNLSGRFEILIFDCHFYQPVRALISKHRMGLSLTIFDETAPMKIRLVALREVRKLLESLLQRRLLFAKHRDMSSMAIDTAVSLTPPI